MYSLLPLGVSLVDYMGRWLMSIGVLTCHHFQATCSLAYTFLQKTFNMLNPAKPSDQQLKQTLLDKFPKGRLQGVPLAEDAGR